MPADGARRARTSVPPNRQGSTVVRLIPREEKYFALLSDLIGKVSSGAGLFVDLLGDYDNRAMYVEKIKSIEKDCDIQVADIVAKLNSSFITPIDREDIYLLTTSSDDIIDAINGLARRLEMVNAVPVRPDFPEIAALLAASLAEVAAAFGQLETRSRVTDHAKRVRTHEKRADTLYADALHRLFTEEPDPIEVVKWATIYEQLEDAIDQSKHLAQSLEGIVVKHA
jgi:uncharacterized protein Yka (UPF0111/DUF47 family)